MYKLDVLLENKNENKGFFKQPVSKPTYNHFKKQEKPIENSVADAVMGNLMKKLDQYGKK